MEPAGIRGWFALEAVVLVKGKGEDQGVLVVFGWVGHVG